MEKFDKIQYTFPITKTLIKQEQINTLLTC